MIVFTKTKVKDRTGLAPRLIQFYTNEGIIKPFSGGGKRGQSWKYSQKNLIEFGIISQLAQHGITIQVVKMIINNLNKRTHFRKLFNEAGQLNQNNPIVTGKQFAFIYIFDAGKKVHFVLIDAKSFDKDKGIPFAFSMKNHKSGLVINISSEIKEALT